nr:hypothetical protein [uncultured Sphingomonas sp.]
MTDTTLLTVNPGVPTALRRARGLHLWELADTAPTYAAFAGMLTNAIDLGYRPVLTAEAPKTVLATDVLMTRLAGLGDAGALIEHGALAGFAQVDASGNVLQLFNLNARAIEMTPGASGGGRIVAGAAGPLLDLSGAQGRGMLCDVDPDVYNAANAGKALIWSGIVDARPGNTGQLARVVSGNITYASVGVVPGGTRWRVTASRRLGTELVTTTLDSLTADVPVGARVTAVLLMNPTAGKLSLVVDGETVIGPSDWGSTQAGTLDATGYTAQLAIPGAGATQNVRHAAFLIASSSNAAALAPLLAMAAAV